MQAAAAAKASRGPRGGGLAGLFGGAKQGKQNDVASKVEARARKAERAAQAAAAIEAERSSNEEAAPAAKPSMLSRPRPVVKKAAAAAVTVMDVGGGDEEDLDQAARIEEAKATAQAALDELRAQASIAGGSHVHQKLANAHEPCNPTRARAISPVRTFPARTEDAGSRCPQLTWAERELTS
jgi:hypothetical protein